MLELGRKFAELRFEDALIILRYGRNLALAEGFVFNPGERVLGVSSPLQTIIAASAIWLAPEHALAAVNLLGVGFLTLTAWMAGWLLRAYQYPTASWLSGLLVVSNLNLTYLYVGMEVPLFAFLVLFAFHLFLSERELWLGVILGVAFWTRYDAALLALLLGAFLCFRNRSIPRRLLAAFFVTVAPWLIFSKLYFGGILPAALGAKHGHTGAAAYLFDVYRYYGSTFATLWERCGGPEAAKPAFGVFCLVVIALGGWRVVRVERRFALLLLYAALHVTTYSVIGADPRFRWHYFILNPVLFMLFAVGFCELLDLAGRLVSVRARSRARVVMAFSFILWGPMTMSVWKSLGRPYRPDQHTLDLFTIARWIEARYDESTTLMNPSIGILGYESKLHIIDHAGLVTPGLRYHDTTRHTPIEDVLDHHEPELVLLPSAVSFDWPAHGYTTRQSFELEHPYVLYERHPGRSEP